MHHTQVALGMGGAGRKHQGFGTAGGCVCDEAALSPKLVTRGKTASLDYLSKLHAEVCVVVMAAFI